METHANQAVSAFSAFCQESADILQQNDKKNPGVP